MDELNIDFESGHHHYHNECLNNESNNSLGSDSDRPKKCVRFNEKVYETFIASSLYDRRNFAKYHFSTRHHPPLNQGKKNVANNKSGSDSNSKKESSFKNKNKKRTSSESSEYTDTSSDEQSSGQEDNTSSIDLIQSSLCNKMSKHNRKDNREKKSTNLSLVEICDDSNDDIFISNGNKNNYDIRSSDYSTKNGLSKQEEEEEEEIHSLENGKQKQPPRRFTIDSGYDSTEEENQCPWTTVKKGRKRWNSASA